MTAAVQDALDITSADMLKRLVKRLHNQSITVYFAEVQEMTPPYKRIHVVINPASGKGQPMLKYLADLCKQYDVEWDISLTKKYGDATQQGEFARYSLVLNEAHWRMRTTPA